MTLVDPIDFDCWKQSPITQLVFKLLKELDEQLQHRMLNPNRVLESEGKIYYARAAGSRDLIREVLNLEFEDLDALELEEETDSGDEETT